MPGKELYPKYARDFFGKQSEIQQQEPVVQQETKVNPVVAAIEADEIIDAFVQGLQSTPQFIEALAKHYFDPNGSTITYPVGETFYYSVQFRKEYNKKDKSRWRTLDFSKYTKNPDGTINKWRADVRALYINDRPNNGLIRLNDHKPTENMPSVIREIREFHPVEFGKPKLQTPQQ